MHRRYTIHRDGDLLVEELDASGKPIEPEPVSAEDRLPVELTLLAPDDLDSRAALLELLEMALDLETHGGDEALPKKHKLDVIS
jgi:hypothetical protein